MKCRRCLAEHTLLKTKNFLPGCFLPLRLLVQCVQCDSCLEFYYRVRLLGWLIPSSGPEIDETL